MSTDIHPEALAAELAGARQTNTVHAVKTGDCAADLMLLCLEAVRSVDINDDAAALVFESLARRFYQQHERSQQATRNWQQMGVGLGAGAPGGAAALGNWKPPEPLDHYSHPPQSSPSPSPSSTAALGSLFDGSTVSCGPLKTRP